MHTSFRRSSLLALGLAALVAAAACGGSGAEAEGTANTPETVRTVPVRTAAVTSRDLVETLMLTGTLDARAQVTVVSEVSARLEQTLKAEGDRVSRGQLLAVLDDVDFKLARDRAEAAVNVAEANRSHAKAEKDRAESLLKTGGITDKDRLAADVAVQVAEASTAQARSELAIAERQFERSKVVAPVSGRIAKRIADAGAMLQPGAPIYSIVDDSVFELRASAASADFGKLKVGEAVKVTVDGLPGLSFDGKVDRIAPQVDARSRSFEIIIQVPGQADLMAGLFARAEVKVRDVPGSLVVPPGALVRDGADPSKATAYVVAGGKAERRDVTVGFEVSDAVQVTGGLNAGEAVVLDPPSAIGPGTPVQVETAKAGS